MHVGSCNVGRGTARRVAEQSKLAEQNDKDKKAKKAHRSETPKPNKDEFVNIAVNNVVPVADNAVPAQNTVSTPVLNKLV
ncbi:MAG TPA: hypothetical protein VHO94_03755 [Oscillospiraceae bacterium]|nr:hypothetical protein [Oscillospiraceae bacterium]